jgi:histidine triad (HIT) family protein
MSAIGAGRGMRVKRQLKGLFMEPDCIFCRIAARKAQAAVLYEDEHCLVFKDTNPQAPVHLLVIPRKHIASLNEDLSRDAWLLGHLLTVAARAAREHEVDGTGFRTVINTNREAGQTVYHLHIHVLGGRRLHWPPG